METTVTSLRQTAILFPQKERNPFSEQSLFILPPPGQDLYSPTSPGLHFSSRANTSHCLPVRHGERRAFLAERWQMAHSELRCPRILSPWLPWLVKAGNSNASARGLPAFLSFLLPRQQRHFKGMAINRRFLDLP